MSMTTLESRTSPCFIDGNEAVALAAIESGCTFFAGYPITPATTILEKMLEHLPSRGGVCIQCEDEISSIGCCLGASMAGKKVMTASSGPGLSLYSEHISFALGSEMPIVIIDVQRLGPSTGSATKGADGDIQFLRWGSSGGLPCIVIAPVDVKDCYVLTMHAFNLAEEFRCPVFIASNKEVGMTKERVDLDVLETPEVVNRAGRVSERRFFPFECSEFSKVPGFLPIGGETVVRQTSSTHGVDGYITSDPEEIESNQRRLKDKIERDSDRLSFYEFHDEKDVDTLLITYGVTARAAKEAYEKEKRNKRPFSLLILKTLWPVPVRAIRESARKVNRVVVVEMNLSQYAREIESYISGKRLEVFAQMNGRLITPHAIRRVLTNE